MTRPASQLQAAAKELDDKIVGIESHLFNLTATGRGQDMLRTPNELVEKLSHLADVVSLADFPPTDQALEVLAMLTKQARGYQDQMTQVVDTGIAAFNRALRDGGMSGGIIAAPPK